MNSNPMHCTLVGGAVAALVLVTSSAFATEATTPAPDVAPVVVAQASMAVVPTGPLAGGQDPVSLRGVRKAATESPEALRRYIWRTRMIYNHWYDDFAPKE